MSWKGQGRAFQGYQKWSGDQTWEWNSKAKKKGKETTEKTEKADNQIVFYGYDGKKVVVGSSSGSSPSSSAADSALRAENAKLKEAMRKSIEEGKVVEVAPEIQQMVRVDPREELKERQRQLNQERKTLNRAVRIKEEMEKKGQKFSSWKASFQQGLAEEEKRHTQVMAELVQELKDAESGNLDSQGPMEEDYGHREEQFEMMSISIFFKSDSG